MTARPLEIPKVVTINYESTLLGLNLSKCCHLLLSRKRSLLIPPPCLTLGTLLCHQLQVDVYLGVLITSALTWSAHISKIIMYQNKSINWSTLQVFL